MVSDTQMFQDPPLPPPALEDLLSPEGFSVLRNAAEALCDRRRPYAFHGESAGLSIHDLEYLLQELHIHQIELELQNESLRATRNRLEQSLQRYEDLYQGAPVALLTLSLDGAIREVNQSTERLLGEPRSALLGRRLGLWISPDTRPAFNTLLDEADSGARRSSRKLRLDLQHRSPCWVLAETVIARSRAGNEIRLALTDIDDRKPPDARLHRSEGRTPVFPLIPGIDRERAADILSGNRTMFLSLLRLLVMESRDLVEQVRLDLAQGRRLEAAARLHNLKGNAGSLGAQSIAALAGRLEAAIDRDADALDTDLDALDRQLCDLIEAATPWLDS